jgi:hypothetical protein
MKSRDIHGTSVSAEVKLGKMAPVRCHDLAEFGNVLGGRDTPQRRRCATKEPSEARGEVAMACKSGIQGDCRQVTAALKNDIQRVGEALLLDVVVDGRADRLAEDMAQMEG